MHDERVPAARGDDPLGADHRRERQQGHARAVRQVPDAARPRARRPRRRRDSSCSDRLLPLEDEEPARDGAHARRATSAARCPTELDDLVKLPGVGRKTGNVVRSVAFDLPGLPVDTHVGRLSRRLSSPTRTDPVKVELDLNALVPPEERGRFSLRLILHGRQVCFARKPNCWALRPGRHLPVGRPERPPQAPTGVSCRAIPDADASSLQASSLRVSSARSRTRRAARSVALGEVELVARPRSRRCRGSGRRRRRPGGRVVELGAQAGQLGEVGRGHAGQGIGSAIRGSRTGPRLR